MHTQMFSLAKFFQVCRRILIIQQFSLKNIFLFWCFYEKKCSFHVLRLSRNEKFNKFLPQCKKCSANSCFFNRKFIFSLNWGNLGKIHLFNALIRNLGDGKHPEKSRDSCLRSHWNCVHRIITVSGTNLFT